MVLINGWCFNFADMRAYRNRHGEHQVRQLRSVGTPPSIVRLTERRTYTNFFDAPEDIFNDVIDREYREYLLTEEIEQLIMEDV